MRGNGVRWLLGFLLTFMALCAVGGGVYGLTGASGVPREWLEGSPFTSYFLPSLILLCGVAGSSAIAALAVLARHPSARMAAAAAGAVQVGWIGAQVLIIGFVSWLQPVVAVWGMLTFALALKYLDPARR